MRSSPHVERFINTAQRQLELEQTAIRKVLAEEEDLPHIERGRLKQSIDDRTHFIELLWSLYHDEVDREVFPQSE